MFAMFCFPGRFPYLLIVLHEAGRLRVLNLLCIWYSTPLGTFSCKTSNESDSFEAKCKGAGQLRVHVMEWNVCRNYF